MTVLWHHGSPQTGALLDPLVDAAAQRDIRLLSYGRPNYGGSTAKPDRTVADAAFDVEEIVDALGIAGFATMGASGGGPHALACAALLGERVTAAVSISGLAPLTQRFDWYAGMVAPDALRAAAIGRHARASLPDAFDTESFTAADWAALEVRWKSLGEDAGRGGTEGLIDDDLAFTSPWGFDVQQIGGPVLVVHGGEDRVVPLSHAYQLVEQLKAPELWLRPRDGHVSILDAAPLALDWLLGRQGEN